MQDSSKFSFDWIMHGTKTPPSPFAELGIEAELLKALTKMGFVEPTPIQQEMIPLALTGKDIIGQARTGTGKTAAFALPILQRLDYAGRLQAIILAPTRELAVQVAAEIRRLGELTPLHCVPIYGGQRIKRQLHLLGRRPHLIVGTPGRVIDMLNRRAFDLSAVRYVVLDEVDRMLDIGFRDDIRIILRQVTQPHQTIFVSATIDEEIKRLATQFMNDAVEVNVSQDDLTVSEVAQYYCSVQRWDKYRLLRRVLAAEKPRLAIVFTNTKRQAHKLARRLINDQVNAREIHGDLVQQKRDRVMDRFRKQQIQVLVATDLAARGIDVRAISHIINYDLPQDAHAYVHRIGRTARMGAFGSAIALVTPDEGGLLTEIEMLINKQLKKMELPDFVPSPPPPGEQVEPEPAEAPSRYELPVFATDEGKTTTTLPKTLGSKFRPARRRRR
jgi:ATP-dependent RNA helicase DeaD